MSKTMWAQEILNTIAQHLIKQGQKSRDHGGSCRYRTTAGLKCAVGCLLADDEYCSSMEGRRVDHIEHMLPERLKGHIRMIRSAQRIHDELAVNEWPGAIRKLALNLFIEVPEGCRES